ncbi:glucosamine-6-phosphate deaminase [Rhodophyticola sp. CCM32]|uniref:glucosamine-6-phosphate deaminase n=1 Tax=Rhodophyticola sp. CCM32 TaxID=2916397 RepID=UPI001EE61EF0|nr:glucosamine-6-phosphate deaminase [Rhodophyticola sp. CCM32]
MEVIPCRDRGGAVALTAHLIAERLRSKPDAVLGLATGRTMEGVYAHLANSGVSFAQCTTFNLDEYVGLAQDDPNSYTSYMRRHLFDHVDIDVSRTHLPDGMATDLARAASDYEARIASCGGIDLQLLGIGNTGHIGFNEPVSSL